MPHLLQFGFVKEHGSISSILSLKESINFYKERNSPICAIFFDTENAFDRVQQDGLLYKLWNIGISGKIRRIVYICYKSTTAHVKYRTFVSREFRIEKCVSEGRVTLFINDLIQQLYDTKYGLVIEYLHIPYVFLADDTSLLCATNRDIQPLLNIVHRYSIKWRQKYNALSNNFLLFSPNKNIYRRLISNLTLEIKS